jgi:hypothetical protein
LEESSVFIDRIIETLFAEVWISPHKKIIVGTLYRPSVNHPTLSSSEQFAQFFDIFSNIMCNFSNLNTPVYLFGDFNLDVLRYNITRQVTEYIDLLFSYGFLQIIMKPTRCTPTSASLIDHCITNSNPESLNCKILTSRISDHFPLLCSIIDCKKNQPSEHFVKKQFFTDENLQNFSTAINAINWDFLNTFDSAQEQYDQFNELFLTLYNQYFPVNTIKINKNFHRLNPWMTKGLLTSRIRKNKLCHDSVKFPYDPFISRYKTYRNLYFKVLTASKKLYFQNSLQRNQSNSKKTWEILRKIVNNSKKSSNSIQNILL